MSVRARVLAGCARGARALSAVVLALAVLAPVVAAGAVLADDLADLFVPDDDPNTPGADLHQGRNPNDGIPDMPSLVTIAPPAEPIALDAALSVTLASAPAPTPILAATRDHGSSSRGPPSPLS